MSYFVSSLVLGTAAVLCVLHVDALLVAKYLAAVSAVRTQQTSIYALATTAYDANGIRNDVTSSSGSRVGINALPVDVDTIIRGNNDFDHLVVCAAVQKLITAGRLPAAGSSISTVYMPNGVSLVNPSWLGNPPTLQQLMMHTSTLIANSRFDPSPQTSGSGNAATDLTTFVGSYYTTASGTGYTTASDIWTTTVQPGTQAAYNPSRANTVLLAYIIHQAVAATPTLVTASAKTEAAFIQEMLDGWGIQNTFPLLPDGSTPLIYAGFQTFDSNMLLDTTSSGALTSTRPIHPASWGGGAMVMTTSADIAKLLYTLFVSSSITSIGTSLLSSLTDVTDSTIAATYGITQIGYGIVTYNTATMCTAANTVISQSAGCVTSSTGSVIGFQASGSTSLTAGYCKDYSSLVTATSTSSTANSNRLCTGFAVAYNPSTTLSHSQVTVPLFAAATNEVFIDPLTTDGTTITEDSQKPDKILGFLIFLVVVAVIFAVMLLSFFAEYFIQPAPVVGPLSAEAYPTIDQHIEKSLAMM